MDSLLNLVDKWFLIFLVIILGAYFLYSIKQLVEGLKDTIKELKDTIKELFEDRNHHAERLKVLEIKDIERDKLCYERHKDRSGVERRKHLTKNN